MLKTYHRGNGEKQRKRRKTMTTGKKQIKISGFSLCPLFFSVSSVVCFVCEKIITRVNGEKKRKRRRTMTTGKNR